MLKWLGWCIVASSNRQANAALKTKIASSWAFAHVPAVATANRQSNQAIKVTGLGDTLGTFAQRQRRTALNSRLNRLPPVPQAALFPPSRVATRCSVVPHRVNRLWRCQQCSFTLTFPSNLKRHQHIYTSECPRQYHLCPSAFSQMAKLVAHLCTRG
ncbi:uncharacterized protein LOC144166331 isoform X1 [Haemaphysalis longicornis]